MSRILGKGLLFLLISGATSFTCTAAFAVGVTFNPKNLQLQNVQRQLVVPLSTNSKVRIPIGRVSTTKMSPLNERTGIIFAQRSQGSLGQTKAEPIEQPTARSKIDDTETSEPMSQVTSVSQLSDVQPTDWAFQALQSLVERYGCIAGYLDGTYRGNRALTRYEFAAGLNACLNRVNELIAAGSSNLVSKDDLATLQKLQQEFTTELAALRGRVDTLEAQTAQLEANQFSVTSKLVGEVVFNVSDNFGNYQDNAVFSDRVRLDFQTSFTGKDVLHTRLATGNTKRFNFHGVIAPGGPNTSLATYDGEGSQILSFEPSTTNSIAIDWLSYYFPLFDRGQAFVGATGEITSDIAPVNNPYFYDGTAANGALSVFAANSPIFRIGGGAGAGLNLHLSQKGSLKLSSLSLVYLADNASNPGPGTGLFNGDYVALGELNFNVNNRFGIAATYAHGYHATGTGIFNVGGPGSNRTPFQGVVGTAVANDPSLLLARGQRPTVTNSYGTEVFFQPTSQISISGFVEETNARILGRGDGNIWSYGLGVAFPDLGKQGNVLGFFAGAEPTLRGLRAVGAPAKFARDYAYHFEGFYKYQLTDNISITPGVIVLTAPGQNVRNNDVWIGTIRTTFTF